MRQTDLEIPVPDDAVASAPTSVLVATNNQSFDLPEALLPAVTLARTKPDSMNRKVLAAFAGAISAADSDGATVAEARAAFEYQSGTEAPALFTTLAYGLLKHGILEHRGGRPGHARLAPAGARRVSDTPCADDAERVLAALRSLSAADARPHSTRAVGRELRRLGLTLTATSQNAVRKRLESLTRDHVRGDAAWATAPVERVTATTATGKPAAFWKLRGETSTRQSDQLELWPRSAAECARVAVRGAVAHVGRPVSATELRWWAEARAEQPRDDESTAERLERHAATRVASYDVSAVLAATYAGDRRFAGEPGRLHLAEGEHRCHGGAPRRYAVEAPTPETMACLRLEDSLRALAPADELREIESLARLAERRGLTTLGAFATLRLAVLKAHLVGAAVPLTLDDALDHVSTALSRTLALANSCQAPKRREARARPVKVQLREVEAARLLVGAVEDGDESMSAAAAVMGIGDPRDVQVVGRAATTTFDDLRPVAEVVARQFDLAPERATSLIENARRFAPSEKLRSRPFVSGERPAPLALVDRVDATLALYAALPELGATIHAQVRSAAALIGRVVRDARVLRRILESLPASERQIRRAVVMALALLGEAPELLADDLADPSGLAAHLAALGASALPQAAIIEALDAIGRRLPTGGRHIVATARMRATMGNRLALAG